MGFLRLLGKLIGLILAVLVILVIPLTLWLYSIQRVVLNPETYQRLLSNRVLYTDILPEMLVGMAQGVQEDPEAPAELRAMADYLEYLDGDDWQTILRAVAPAPWLQAQFEDNIEGIFEWLDGPNSIPDAGFDLTPVKDRLAGDQGEEVVRTVVGSWPLCTDEEAVAVRAILGGEAGEEAVVLPCRLEGEENIRLIQNVTDVVVEAAESLPDTIPEPGDIEQLSPQQEMEILNFKILVGITRHVAHLIFIIPLILLVLIELVAIRSFRELFVWYGWSLSLGGLLSLVPLLVLPLMLWSILTSSSLTLGAPHFGVALISTFTNTYGQFVLTQGGLLIAVGAGLLIIASLIRPPTEQFIT